MGQTHPEERLARGRTRALRSVPVAAVAVPVQPVVVAEGLQMKLEYSRCLYLRADIDEKRERKRRKKRSKRFSLNPAWKQRSITNKALKTQNETVAENRRCMRTNSTSSPQKQGTSGAPFQIQEQERRDRREKERESGREREYKNPRRDNKDPISDGNFDEGDEKPTKKEQQG